MILLSWKTMTIWKLETSEILETILFFMFQLDLF